jgi:hypothetical protein
MEDVMKDTSSIPADLASLLADLPPESLRVLEEFARFLHEQARQGRVIQPVQEEKTVPYLYPTVGMPASTLDDWLNLVPEGYEGDALMDTEALYEEA